MQENLGRSGARTTSRFGINVGFSFSLSLFFSNNGRRSPLANREHEPKPASEATPSTSAGGGCDDGQAACSRRAVEVDGVASLEHAVEHRHTVRQLPLEVCGIEVSDGHVL